MWSRPRKKLLNHRTGFAEHTGPIPKPDHDLGMIYHTAKQDVITLQEQMCLEDDTKTFLEFTVRHGGTFSLPYASLFSGDAEPHEAKDRQLP